MTTNNVVRMRWEEEKEVFLREVKKEDFARMLRKELEKTLKTVKRCEDFHFGIQGENWKQRNQNKSDEMQNIVNLIEAVELAEDIFFYVEDNIKDFKLDYWFPDGSKFTVRIPKSCLWIFLQEVPKDKVRIPETIRFSWMLKGESHNKEMDRKYVLEIFKSFIYDYPENNTISKQIVHYVPIIEEMYVNWDSTEPIKCLYLKTISGECKGLSVIYHHKIVWQKLAELYGVIK